MHEGLQLLAELTDDDVSWLQHQGHDQQTIAGTLLIREGEHPDAIFVVLEGLVGIEVEAITNQLRGYHQQTFPTNWVCEGRGIVRCIPGDRVDLITREKFKDFELTLDWKLAKGANSGILYGVSEAASETYWSGPEMQVNDDPNHPDGKTPKFSAGALYDLIAPNDSKKLFRTGEYNHVRILSRKGHVEFDNVTFQYPGAEEPALSGVSFAARPG